MGNHIWSVYVTERLVVEQNSEHIEISYTIIRTEKEVKIKLN